MGTELAPGATVGRTRYRLERLLGTGGMASVWLAKDERLDRPVAVKVISEALARDEPFQQRFAREARIAASLEHPNLVRVLDAGRDGSRPFLVMEYVSGGTLAERLRDGRPPPAGYEALARELLAALAHVHRAGIVHRDITPSNVLIDAHGRARLGDFGIARGAETTQLTSPGQLIGTLKYIAPEVARGAPATLLSDLYSLGVLLRECSGDSPSSEMARLVAGLTRPEPEHRPESASAAKALLDCMPTEVVPTVRVPAPVPRAGSRRRRTLFGLIAAAAAAGLIGVALVSGGGGGASAPRVPAAPEVRPGAPLSQQLDALENAVKDASRP